MRFGRILLALFVATNFASAAAPTPPAHLPKYDLRLELDPGRHLAEIRLRVKWTNPTDRPTKQLVFNFYPHYTIPREDRLLIGKTLELFRLSPSDSIDPIGKQGRVNEISLKTEGEEAKALRYSYQEDNPSALVVDLPNEVGPGQSVVVEIDCTIRMPNKQGRWGHWRSVHFLANSLPTLGYYDVSGWHAMPYVPWHQPFWNEAGEYTARIVQPKDQTLACSAPIVARRDLEGGRTEITTAPFVGRDFALLWSPDYKEYTSNVTLPDGRTVAVRCLAFEKHEFYAKEILRIVGEALPTFSKWFGPYPYDHFTIAESYFGWNGNECAGLIMIDERVFDMPHLAVGYVEYLVSHETCHQWWYNLVGTNGYAETFMDEGPATYFTHRLLDKRLGKNNEFLKWPDTISFAPNIRRENYRFSSLMAAVRRNEVPPAAAPLPEFGNIYGLFSGAYDRGSKVYGMIESRLGEAAFLDFIRGLVVKYSFKQLSAVALKRELEDFTGKNWDDLFDRWVYGNGLTDWGIERVEIDGERVRRFGPLVRSQLARKGGHAVEVILSQSREYDEPTSLGFRFAGQKGFPVRVPVGPTPETIRLAEHDTVVEPLGNGRCRVRLVLPEAPVEIVVDPDRVLLDADPADNVWPRRPRVTLTPLYSLATETGLTADYDRMNINAGFWAFGPSYTDPWYTRSFMTGLRAGAYRPDVYQGGLYSAFRLDYRDLVVGIDGLIDHVPFPKSQIGFNVERRVGGPFFNLGSGTAGDGGATRATVYGRYIHRQATSLYLAPIQYTDVYTAYSDNFLPDSRERDPQGVRPGRTWLNGLHHRLNLYTPYWDPETGAWVDVSYGLGTTQLDTKDVLAHQLKAELAITRKLPDGLGYFSGVKVAGRGVIQAGWPNRGEYFALGGSTLFRGFDLAERQGSLLWVANAEARFPVFRDRRWNFMDNTAGVRNVHVAAFYDVGGVYTNNRLVTNTAHALGGGVRVDLAIFSFIERATIRLDIAKTVNSGAPVQLWYGLLQPF